MHHGDTSERYTKLREEARRQNIVKGFQNSILLRLCRERKVVKEDECVMESAEEIQSYERLWRKENKVERIALETGNIFLHFWKEEVYEEKGVLRRRLRKMYIQTYVRK